MFLRIIKETFLKKIVNKRLNTYKLEDDAGKIKTIALLINATSFDKKDALIAEINKYVSTQTAIEVLLFKDKKNKKESIEEPFYTVQDISINGNVKKASVQEFLNKPFDMLISYYDEPKPSLDLIAKKSKAKFKVGFADVDNRINHFMIDTTTDEYKLFVSELFKYLHVLKKI